MTAVRVIDSAATYIITGKVFVTSVYGVCKCNLSECCWLLLVSVLRLLGIYHSHFVQLVRIITECINNLANLLAMCNRFNQICISRTSDCMESSSPK